jgi:glycosyltransferase involved in cell wall biosynthesis
LETGPLVVLESFAAGVPVVGSNLGGIAEWVKHEKNGLLVQHENVRGWTDALRRCADDRNLVLRLRNGIEAPRTMMMVAQEMAQMYRRSVQPGAVLSGPGLAQDTGLDTDHRTAAY